MFIKLAEQDRQTALHLVVLLRLAVLLLRSRKEETAIIESITGEENGLTIRFAEGEMEKHSLQLAILEQEAKYLRNVDFALIFS